MIKENELQLSVKKLELGTLTTNAIAIRDKVKELLLGYSASNYSEETIDKAKEDKALLNKTSKALNDERIRLEEEFNKPFEEFKGVVKETTDMIKNASSKIDEIVKEVEEKTKTERKKIILDLFNNSVEELKEIITFEMIFDEKWLNKGSFNEKGEFKLDKDLENKLETIRTDLQTIRSLKSKHELALINQYLKDFNLGNVIIENNRLNELETSTKTVTDTKIEIMTTKPVQTEEIDPIQAYILKITGTLSQHKKLKEFLELNKMPTINAETGKVIVE